MHFIEVIGFIESYGREILNKFYLLSLTKKELKTWMKNHGDHYTLHYLKEEPRGPLHLTLLEWKTTETTTPYTRETTKLHIETPMETNRSVKIRSKYTQTVQ